MSRPKWALAAILALAAVLYAWGIWAWGWGNSYYTAATRSMSSGFVNFLFGSFDQAGVVTVDKPPFALWPQVVSTWIFGFHGWAILLPQAVFGVAAVFLLHRTVRMWAGENAALLAALVLALTPITVVINRDNNPDTLLVLFLVGAAYAITRSIQPDIAPGAATRWLLLAAFLVGCGFNTKMLAAWIVVPALVAAYLVGSTAPWRRRITDTLGAGGVLLASSLWWVALVDLWPGRKPYIGGSTDGTAFDLVIGYNGLARILGMGGGGPGGMPGDIPAGFPGGENMSRVMRNLMMGGDPGLGRMFNEAMGGQISWLLPAALVVLAGVLVASRRNKDVPAHQRAGWVLWGGWLLVNGLVFSFAGGIFHSYYTTALAPAIAALIGAGVVAAQRVRFGVQALAVITAAWALVVVYRSPDWNGWVGPVVVVLAVLAVAAFRAPARVTAPVGVAAMLFAPAVWSVSAAFGPPPANASLPTAGPESSVELRQMMPPQMSEVTGGDWTNKGDLSDEQRKVLDYATAKSGGARITLGVDGGAIMASNFVLNSGRVVIGFGGFMGVDPAPTTEEIAGWVRRGELRFVLAGRTSIAEMTKRGGQASERMTWVRDNCTVVPREEYGGTTSMLYECR
ncbi:ArnT family glycosyltransferase [Allokutzneria albata]|uniref:4-amino-4-deoxy-L-arabinose transferase n=1 Tax=Allokutzneria albata TaxID=211114 RepID=A0A1G9SXZ9_ALLAB|nr:glycosyltransferase family 39 protein [Allokutzneria albata]SDM40338.1 4-amino-4-deoxy-L-arabinose transferase [Allokutzneria albata]